MGYDEFGLRRLAWEEIDAWRRRWFVAENAVLWVAGDLPEDVRIGLPSGAGPAPAPAPATIAPLPGFTPVGRGGIGMSLVGRQSNRTAVARFVLRERLTQVLRHERGLSYGVNVASEAVSSELTHVWLAADALPDQVATVAHTVLGTFDELAGSGCRAEEIEDYASKLRQTMEAPGGAGSVLHRRAQKILTGQPAYSPEQVLQQVSEVTGAEVAQEAASLLESAIVATPGVIPAVKGRMPRLPPWSAQEVTGTVYRAAGSAAVLTVGSEGVMLRFRPGQQLTVRWLSAAAMLRWTGGKVTVIGTDGFSVTVDPAQWRDGGSAVRAIEAQVSPGLVASMDTTGPQVPLPPAEAGPLRWAQMRWQQRMGLLTALLLCLALYAAISALSR